MMRIFVELFELDFNHQIAWCRRVSLRPAHETLSHSIKLFSNYFRSVCSACKYQNKLGSWCILPQPASTQKISHKEIHLALSSAAGGHKRITHTSLLDLRQKHALLYMWLCAEFLCFWCGCTHRLLRPTSFLLLWSSDDHNLEVIEVKEKIWFVRNRQQEHPSEGCLHKY